MAVQYCRVPVYSSPAEGSTTLVTEELTMLWTLVAEVSHVQVETLFLSYMLEEANQRQGNHINPFKILGTP